jgi:zinc transporter ZupT
VLCEYASEDDAMKDICEGVKSMKLNLPKKTTFWAAVVIAIAGVIVYVIHLITFYLFKVNIIHMELIAFLLELAAFILLYLGLTMKGL